jgi:flagellar M-ring protein FliF
VINASFVAPEVLEALPEIPIWEQSWFMSVVKQVLAGLVVLYLIFGIIRPAFKNLSRSPEDVLALEGSSSDVGTLIGTKGSDGRVITSLDADGKPLDEFGNLVAIESAAKDANGKALPSPDEIYQLELELARKLVLEDPQVAAQVIKNWIKV